ncbi:unnamed protein product [Camellia sinensis]
MVGLLEVSGGSKKKSAAIEKHICKSLLCKFRIAFDNRTVRFTSYWDSGPAKRMAELIVRKSYSVMKRSTARSLSGLKFYSRR